MLNLLIILGKHLNDFRTKVISPQLNNQAKLSIAL